METAPRITRDALRTLPIEIYSAILSLAIAIGSANFRYGKIDTILNVALVCREWYEMVFSEPSIWTSFAIDVGAAEEYRLNAVLPIVRRWYDRSGNLPLRFCLDAGGVSTQKTSLQPLVNFILSIDRWETLQINTGDIFPGRRLLENLFDAVESRGEQPNPFRRLRRFRCDLDGRDYPKFHTSMLDRLARLSPQLEVVKLSPSRFEDSLANIPTALSRARGLTHVDLRSLGGHQEFDFPLMSTLLSSIPTLQGLALVLSRDENLNGTPPPPPAAQYPNLKILDVTFFGTTCIEVAEIGVLTFPNLEILHLTLLKGLPAHLHGPVLKLLKGSPRLKRLSTRLLKFTTEQLLDILPSLPALRCIHFSENYEAPWADGRLFEGLFQLSQEGRVLPDLQEIAIRHPGSENFVAAFTKFVEDPKRWHVENAAVGSFARLRTAIYEDGRSGLFNRGDMVSIPGFPYKRGNWDYSWLNLGLTWF